MSDAEARLARVRAGRSAIRRSGGIDGRRGTGGRTWRRAGEERGGSGRSGRLPGARAARSDSACGRSTRLSWAPDRVRGGRSPGAWNARRLAELVEAEDDALPETARATLQILVDGPRHLDERIAGLDAETARLRLRARLAVKRTAVAYLMDRHWMSGRLRRREDDDRAARPVYPSLRHRRDRQRELALQNLRVTKPPPARSGCAV
jgi:hypothetical protein